MSTHSPCPSGPELERLLLGKLAAPEAERLESHLGDCPVCLRSARDLRGSDLLLQALAHARFGAEPRAEDGHVARLVESLQTRPPAAPPGEKAAAARAKPLDDVLLGLAPAREPDELGRLGPYRVLRVLGAGGMGVVFEAEDPQLRRRVALKVMAATSRQARERFLREGRAIAALAHDHVVAIHHVGEERGLPFLVMPLLRGETLAARLRRLGRLTPAEVLRIGREVADGLAAAHERGLIHRDVKPANLWLEEGTGRVKVLDFGLALTADGDSRLTAPGLAAGTPGYMAPELARGQAGDARADLYSLGCTLYEMATGRVPFDSPNPRGVLRLAQTESPTPPRDLNRELPRELSDLIMRLLARDPDARPATAREVGATLAALAAGRRPRRPAWGWLAALAAGLVLVPLGVWYGPFLVRVVTNRGELVLDTEDPDVELAVKRHGELVRVLDRKTGRSVDLPAGPYEVELRGESRGVSLSTSAFELTRGGQKVVTVRWTPAAPAPRPEGGTTSPGPREGGTERQEPPAPLPPADLGFLLGLDFQKPTWPALEIEPWKRAPLAGQYQWVAKSPGYWADGVFSPPMGDFVCEVQGRLAEKADGGWGLGFGLQKPYGWDPWSCVQLRADGRSRACYYHEGGLTPWLPSPAVRPITAANVLRVEMRGQNVRWFLNGQYVGQVNHPRSRPGELALHWFANEAPVDVRFERVRLWRIDPSADPVSEK